MPILPAVSRRAVWGLWCCLTLAALGLTLLLAGALAQRTETLWPGAALMAFAGMLYLIVHFWATATASLAQPAEPARTPGPAAHPTPRARPPVVRVRSSARLFDDSVGWQTGGAAVEERLEAAPPLPVAATTNGHATIHRAPASAVERRKEWIDQMPLAKAILDTPAPAPATDEVPPGKTRGRCGGCNTVLLAPASRPVRLRCPTCGRVAWLR